MTDSPAATSPRPPAEPAGASARFRRYVRSDRFGPSLHLLVEGVHCGGCVAKIERALAAEDDVTHARVNLTNRRLLIRWTGPDARADALVGVVERAGFPAVPFDPQRLDDADAAEDRRLLRALAVAGFASANIMLLSVSVWAGHAQGMSDLTRALFHWFSALIALPTIAYSGRIFFASAWRVLRRGRTNMDVPISLAILLASGMSLVETINHGKHAYFDSAVMLLFFLLVGRFLDHRARGRARAAASRLLALRGEAVTVLTPRGTTVALPPEEVEPGMTVLVAAGQRFAVDAVVEQGTSAVDTSLITGESLPVTAAPGTRVFAGTVNQTAPLTCRVTAAGDDTLLGEIVRLMDVAEQRRARFVTLADRLARGYAPVVHLLAALTFVGWLTLGGLGWQPALMIAIAVLIITCPCALGLAVPVVQVIASGRLMRQGILLKTATALERMIAIDTVVFDKTGTLTKGALTLVDSDADAATLAEAAALAATSRHPLARALVAAAPPTAAATGVREVAGAGLERDGDDGPIRLGRRDWCLGGIDEDPFADGPELWFVRPGRAPAVFRFHDDPRPDAAAVVARLKAAGLDVRILSGDRLRPVAATAAVVGIDDWQAGLTPVDKVAAVEALGAAGRQVLMVGDGLNDAPALAAAHVSMSPTSAADIAQTAADAVFQGERLGPVLETLGVARRADRLVRQNFAMALGYNVIAVPIAVAGLVTPLIAALAMSASSILVVSNALRLGGAPNRRTGQAGQAGPAAPAGAGAWTSSST